MNLKKETENIILVVTAVIAVALLMHFIGTGYTEFAVYNHTGNETSYKIISPETAIMLENKVDLCRNGIKDQGEKGIDCGGLCKKCNSIITILLYTNYTLFILLVMAILILLDKGVVDTVKK